VAGGTVYVQMGRYDPQKRKRVYVPPTIHFQRFTPAEVYALINEGVPLALARWGVIVPVGEVQMFKGRTAAYVADVGAKVERIRSEDTKLLRLKMRVAPFSAEQASELGPGVRSKLYRLKDGEPVDDVATVTFLVRTQPQNVKLFAAPDIEKPSVFLEGCRIGKRITVRRDKETPVYEATLTIDAGYPTAGDLLWLFQQFAGQVWLTFDQAQASLFDDAEGDTGDDE
jgi:hypothetical protein